MSNKKPNHKVSEPMAIYGQPVVGSLELLTHVLGGAQAIGKKIKNILDFLDVTEKGLPIVVLKKLQKRMQFTNRELGKSLDMSESTLQRRLKLNQKLDKKESESAIHLASVWAKGIEVFEDEEMFRTWLHTKNKALGDNKPLDLLHSPIGRDEIKDLLSRIEWGVYS
jgi:putative toxin-antitoxin system antitoxin component (TIGR02293 family)